MRSKFVYLFLFLLSLAFYLTHISSYPLISKVVGSVSSLLLPILELKHHISYKVKNLVNTYVFLIDVQKENKRLLEEVGQLSIKVSELETCKRELSQLRDLEGFMKTPDYLIASLIAYDPSGRDEFFIIDKGKKDGLEEGYVAVHRDLLVGVVDHVYVSTSRVRTVWSNTLSVSATTNGKNYIYRGGFPTGRLLHVLQEDEVKQGDKVLLRSLNFPSFEIGKVYGTPSPEEQFFKRVEVKPEADVRKMEFVAILRRRL
ncbi:rod shape-determining protein MreC [Thermocrinis sp.]